MGGSCQDSTGWRGSRRTSRRRYTGPVCRARAAAAALRPAPQPAARAIQAPIGSAGVLQTTSRSFRFGLGLRAPTYAPVRVAKSGGTGTMVVWAQVAAQNPNDAKSLLEAQYGRGNVIGIPLPVRW